MLDTITNTSLEDFYDDHLYILETCGWFVELGEDSLSLFRDNPNGQPLTDASICLYFEEYEYDLVMNTDGEFDHENIRKREKPWIVRVVDKGTATFEKLSKATRLLLDQADKLSSRSRVSQAS